MFILMLVLIFVHVPSAIFIILCSRNFICVPDLFVDGFLFLFPSDFLAQDFKIFSSFFSSFLHLEVIRESEQL